MGKHLREGLVAGTAGGVAAAVYLALVVQPILREAIALEKPTGGVHDELFSRSVQQIGGAVGTVLYGALIGVILGAVLALVRHRLRGDDWQRSLRVAATGFVSVLLVPFLKYPGNPPGVGDPATVSRRTGLYLLFLGLSVLAAWSGWRVARTLRARGRRPDLAAAVGVGAYVIAAALAALSLPGSGNVVSLPADLVWRFRIASLGGSALMMAVAGLVLGWRLLRHAAPVAEGADARA